MSLNLGHLGHKLGQYVKEILCGCCRGHVSCSINLKIGQNVCLDEISDEFLIATIYAQLINFPVNWAINLSSQFLLNLPINSGKFIL